ncbi:uncharacterized protein LOC130358406 [Hyla sarda]|uniref:uncharacterized protein LOC130358406 n=1 Tax=Hyla sarda TaxID=327740 RepID=UPI0024C26DA2|nr:uncharacterized protein LOC130358406 [Hyla sarda]
MTGIYSAHVPHIVSLTHLFSRRETGFICQKPLLLQFYAKRKMKRRRRRGGANCGRASNAKNAPKPENTCAALDNAGQLLNPEETREETCMNWHFRKQETDEVKGLKRQRTWKIRKGLKPNTGPPINLLPSKLKSRPRNIRFSNVENMTLVSRLVPVYEQLLGKSKSRTPFLKKCQMWQEICDAVNSVGNKQRFVHHCKKRFSDVKRKLRHKLNHEKSLLMDQVGPSAYKVYYTPYEEELKKVLPAEVIDGIEFFDSDHPQEPCSGEDARRSWCTPQNGHNFLVRKKISPELPNTTEPEELESPIYPDQWPMLPELFPVDTSNVRSMDFFTDHTDLPPGRVDTKRIKLCPSRYTIEQPSPHSVPNGSPNHGAHLLKVLSASQKRFRNGMMHSLDVLHSDLRHFNKCIDESNSIVENLLRVESERNNILDQMNIRLGRLAESVEQLANQQQAEHVLLQDYPRRLIPSHTVFTSIRGRNGASHRAGEVHHSLRISS